jgi:hypothetical protein
LGSGGEISAGVEKKKAKKKNAPPMPTKKIEKERLFFHFLRSLKSRLVAYTRLESSEAPGGRTGVTRGEEVDTRDEAAQNIYWY